jgi:hypothetical protein
VKELNKPI